MGKQFTVSETIRNWNFVAFESANRMLMSLNKLLYRDPQGFDLELELTQGTYVYSTTMRTNVINFIST